MSPVQSYRRLLDLAGVSYVVVAFLGRLPLAMSQFGTLLLVSGATGKYAAGGLAAGALALVNAFVAPVAGGIADRIGQRPVVLVQSVTAAASLVALVLLVGQDCPLPAIVATAAVAGAAIPQVGPLARVRWRPITRSAGDLQPKLVNAAFSYEGAADEASFVFGPAMVGLVAVLINPSGALLLAATMLAVFGCWFAVHPTAVLTRPDRASRAKATERLLSVDLVLFFAAQVLIGVVFGATQTGTTVLATSAGQPGVAGFVHAMLGVGSVITGLAVAGLPERFGYDRRLVLFASGLLVLSVPLLIVETLPALVVVVLGLGLAVAPYMITVFTLTGWRVPPSRVGAAMTLLAGATGIGYALGSGVAGRLADAAGHTAAFGVTVTAGAVASALALFRLRRERSRDRVAQVEWESLALADAINEAAREAAARKEAVGHGRPRGSRPPE
ncbi:MAG TPA: MFS transporter [Jiangellaceae bacterium]